MKLPKKMLSSLYDNGNQQGKGRFDSPDNSGIAWGARSYMLDTSLDSMRLLAPSKVVTEGHHRQRFSLSIVAENAPGVLVQL